MARQAEGLIYAVRPRVLLKYFGQFCFVIGGLVLVPLGVALYFGETGSAARYLLVIGLLAGLGFGLRGVRAAERIQDNEALVLAAWLFLFTPLIMAYPMMSAGLDFVDALFETISGATTTGLSTLSDVESLPRGFLFSRAWMQWYGGLGIVILSVALVVRPGMASKSLAIGEAQEDDLIGGTKARAHQLLMIYGFMTGLAVLVSLAVGLGFFDAVVFSLAAVSTGGFAPYNSSLAAVGPGPGPLAVTLFCIAGAVPLALYRRPRKKERSPAGKVQLRGLLICGTLLTALLGFCLWTAGTLPKEEIYYQAPLMAFSAQTTSGFSTLNPSSLDAGSKLVLLAGMFLGGGVGSTAGGIKILRLLIVLRLLGVALLRKGLARHGVLDPHLGGQRLLQEEIFEAFLLIFLFSALVFVSWFPFLILGYSPIDSLFEVVSATGTVGLSAGLTRPDLPDFLKGVLCLDMLLGRLEIVAWIVFLNPGTWIGRRWPNS